MAGTIFAIHVKPGSSPEPHSPELESGSGSVFINGKQAGRIGDSLECSSGSGDAIAQGSTNVFIGG
jgi:uncharacterized Zn-binding protein involved in type VI secretion